MRGWMFSLARIATIGWLVPDKSTVRKRDREREAIVLHGLRTKSGSDVSNTRTNSNAAMQAVFETVNERHIRPGIPIPDPNELCMHKFV